MIIIAAQDIPCPVCGAEPGEKCTYVHGPSGKRSRAFRFGCHSRRCYDAAAAQSMANTLVG